MTESKQPKNERELRELLKKEALAARPDFSQPLHDRFCNGIRASAEDEVGGAQNTDERDGVALPLKNRNGRRLHPRRGPFAAAGAACLAVAAGVFWWSYSSPPRVGPPAGSPNPLVTLADVAGKATLDTGLTADNALAANQWGRLDEDAPLERFFARYKDALVRASTHPTISRPGLSAPRFPFSRPRRRRASCPR